MCGTLSIWGRRGFLAWGLILYPLTAVLRRAAGGDQRRGRLPGGAGRRGTAAGCQRDCRHRALCAPHPAGPRRGRSPRGPYPGDPAAARAPSPPLLPRLTSCDRHGVLFRRTPRLRPAPDLASAPASVPTPQHETAATGSHPRVTSQPPPPATGRLPPGRTASSVDRGSQSECHTSCHGSNAWARSVRPCDSALLFNINQNRT